MKISHIFWEADNASYLLASFALNIDNKFILLEESSPLIEIVILVDILH